MIRLGLGDNLSIRPEENTDFDEIYLEQYNISSVSKKNNFYVVIMDTIEGTLSMHGKAYDLHYSQIELRCKTLTSIKQIVITSNNYVFIFDL